MGSTHGAAQHRKVLRLEIDYPAIDLPVSGYYGIPERPLVLHAKLMALVLRKHIEFNKGTLVKEEGHPFSSCQLTSLVLPLHRFFAGTESGLFFGSVKLFYLFVHTHCSLTSRYSTSSKQSSPLH
jgi:hypothetical protein